MFEVFTCSCKNMELEALCNSHKIVGLILTLKKLNKNKGSVDQFFSSSRHFCERQQCLQLYFKIHLLRSKTLLSSASIEYDYHYLIIMWKTIGVQILYLTTLFFSQVLEDPHPNSQDIQITPIPKIDPRVFTTFFINHPLVKQKLFIINKVGKMLVFSGLSV